MSSMFKALWSYRGFISGSVKREFQSKYRNSLLGALWTVLNPLAMIIVYTVIFSEVMRAKLPGVDSTFGYSIYLCAGILTWGLFAELVGRSQTVFIENANLLKKISFPRLCLPVVVVANAGINFIITFSIFTAFLVVSGNFPGWAFVAMIPLLVILVFFSIGLGITLGVLNVFFRDVGQFFGIFITFWFWLTPIIYPVSALSEKLRVFIDLNPMTSLMAAFQGVLVSGQWPHWETLWPIISLAAFLCFVGMRFFRKHAGEIVDEL
ncbi:ABC transporter permease [Pseudomonas chlororaphis]|uniref:ABC transporter permease n=1 Tax=Pseudomonas chlororaphis TaxID=587753 RepID=UPI002365A104|nr:ABC transporter permease [Pseudomonas chlororaphis]WDH21150.1 ABC transporter permease [Pseudomonas chlororaphis]